MSRGPSTVGRMRYVFAVLFGLAWWGVLGLLWQPLFAVIGLYGLWLVTKDDLDDAFDY